jgi:hypothetical protein
MKERMSEQASMGKTQEPAPEPIEVKPEPVQNPVESTGRCVKDRGIGIIPPGFRWYCIREAGEMRAARPILG